jgi:hypothetical protein
MQKFDDLWQAIETRVCENNDITHEELTNETTARGSAAKQRVAHIFTLEVLLSRHREKYASPYVALAGKRLCGILFSSVLAGNPLKLNSSHSATQCL